jgi:hypothetical protein
MDAYNYKYDPDKFTVEEHGDTEEGRKDDLGKLRWDLLLWPEIEQVVAVLTYGAKRYDADNWQKVPSPVRRYSAAAYRHLVEWEKGNMVDKESGLPHLAHAATNLLFLMYFNSLGLSK